MLVCSAARMNAEESRSVLLKKYVKQRVAFYTTRENHPSRMALIILIGRKYKIETSTGQNNSRSK